MGERVVSLEQIKNAGIVLIDNDLVNILALKNILHAHGFKHISSVKPVSSEQLFSPQNLPDLIVLNLDNTNSGKLGLLKKIKQDMGSMQIPILVVTRDVNSEVTKQALHIGAKEVLSWPFTEVEVVSRVTNLLESFLLSNALKDTDRQTANLSNPHLRVIELSRQIEQQKKIGYFY